MIENKNKHFFISCSVSLILIAFFVVQDSSKIDRDENRPQEVLTSDQNMISCSEAMKNQANSQINLDQLSSKIVLNTRATSLDTLNSADSLRIKKIASCLSEVGRSIEFTLTSSEHQGEINSSIKSIQGLSMSLGSLLKDSGIERFTITQALSMRSAAFETTKPGEL